MYGTIVCLVGENPLPIYLGIRHYAGPDTKIVLIQTGDRGTAKQAEAIARKAIKDKIAAHKSAEEASQLVVIHPAIGAYDPQGVIRAARKYREPGKALLNYTGGTKIMSSFSVLAWYHNVLDPEELPRVEDAIYLEEESGGFRRADGTLEKLALNRPLSLMDLVDIHQIEPHPHRTKIDYDLVDLQRLFSMRYVYDWTYKPASPEEKAFDRIIEWPR